MVAHPSALDVEVEGSEVQGHSQLHNEFEVSLGYLRVHLDKRKMGCARRKGQRREKIEISV